MYLTQAKLNLKNKNVLYNMANCQWVHTLILQTGFKHIQTDNIRQNLKILYTLQNNILLIQSAEKPEFVKTSIYEEMPKTINIDNMSLLIQNGNVVYFSCICNPVTQNKGVRTFIKNRQKREEWFLKKINDNGGEVLTLEQGPWYTVYGHKKDYDFKFNCVKFNGILKITDAEKLWNLFCEGLGKEKSYGCGMLQIKRCA